MATGGIGTLYGPQQHMPVHSRVDIQSGKLARTL